ncbi:MAG: glutamyl-tRNA reductase [Dehalococcoidia bacterium]
MKSDSGEMMNPRISVVGVNYGNTPLTIRGMLSIPDTRRQEAFICLRNYVSKGVVLATCNRTEVYVLDDDEYSAAAAIRRFLYEWSGISEVELEPYLYSSHDVTAARHLCRAASGLYSMIIGEYEILGQVRQALEDAEEANLVNFELRSLFQHAIRTGRRVRDETEISKNALSVSSVAVDLAARATGDVGRCRVLLLGAGEAGKLVAKALSDRGVRQMTVSSRSLSSAQDLAADLGAQSARIEDLRSQMEMADIMITCTGAPHYVVYADLVEVVMSSRADRPLVIVDIAVPRDVEPQVGEIDGVLMYDIDDLDEVSEANRAARQREVDRAMLIVDDELEKFLARWQELEAKPVISALSRMADGVRQRQLEIALKKLPSLSPEEREVVEAMTKAVVSKILHGPIRCLKDNGGRDEDYVRIVSELFALDERGS